MRFSAPASLRSVHAAGVRAAGVGAGARPAYVSLFGDYFPNRHDTTELRARLFVEEKVEKDDRARTRVVVTASGFVEGLLSRRLYARISGPSCEAVNGAHRARPRRQCRRCAVNASTFSLGYARIAWGKLDEIQPTDVINPLDVSRFFFEGRSEARLPMLLARARVHLSESVTVDGVYLPDFRRGRFDQLDEPSSPFNLPVQRRRRSRGVPGDRLPGGGDSGIRSRAGIHGRQRAGRRASVRNQRTRRLEPVGVSRVRDVSDSTRSRARSRRRRRRRRPSQWSIRDSR